VPIQPGTPILAEKMMIRISRGQSIAALALFGAGLASGLMAQSQAGAPFRTEQRRADLTGAPGMEVVASIVEIKPGESSTLHFHHGIEVAYVLEGAMTQAPGKEPALNATGTTILNPRNEKHGAFTVVGDKPLRLFTVHIVEKNKPLYDYSH
jgi:quercetin dioxygenase-like cupin family protein